MHRRSLLALLLLWLSLWTPAVASAGSTDAADRLDRFRELATRRLGALEVAGSEPAPAVLDELYGLLDDEIVESLRSGSPFDSEGFLQERLDAFSETWGGATFRILGLRGSRLTVGAFQLSPSGWGNSVRVYGPTGPGAGLLLSVQREGVPELVEMPPTGAGDPQFLLAWTGPPSSRGTEGLRLELWRGGGESVRLVWSSESLGDEGLFVSRFSVAAHRLSFRYEVRYPGWKPGCDGQTEYEDLYRYASGAETFVLVRRQVVNGWHRDLHRALAAFLSALETGNDRGLAPLVSDRTLLRRLPPRLETDLGCDQAEGSPPTAVTVAAISPNDGRPWRLVFRLTARGWRLAAATPLE